MDYIPQIGDIILSDGTHFGAKCVKFFMQSPTIWHQLYYFITKKLVNVPYYHVAMIINRRPYIIEQQKTVQVSEWKFNGKQIIFRKKFLTFDDTYKLFTIAYADIDKKYDILNIFGKLFTWLTGIKWFARYIESPNKEICVNRVCKWYLDALNEKFGAKKHSEITTQSLYYYLLNNPNYEVVYKKD
ncbi:MAG: hypothetical protein WC516_05885 [Patescibacteria group bacterium]|jgi:hypothetical protein